MYIGLWSIIFEVLGASRLGMASSVTLINILCMLRDLLESCIGSPSVTLLAVAHEVRAL